MSVKTKIYALEDEMNDCMIEADARVRIQMHHIASKIDNVFRMYKNNIRKDEGIHMIQLIEKIKFILQRIQNKNKNSNGIVTVGNRMNSDMIRLNEVLHDLKHHFKEEEIDGEGEDEDVIEDTYFNAFAVVY